MRNSRFAAVRVEFFEQKDCGNFFFEDGAGEKIIRDVGQKLEFVFL